MGSRTDSYRREAMAVLDGLRGPQLRVARDFLAFLQMKGPSDPTLEVLSNPDLVRDIQVGRATLRRGRARLARWEDVRRDV